MRKEVAEEVKEEMAEEEEERARGRQKGEEGRQCARKRAIDSNVGDILRRRDREQWEKEGERQRQKGGERGMERERDIHICTRAMQRGMMKEEDKARVGWMEAKGGNKRGLFARERVRV